MPRKANYKDLLKKFKKRNIKNPERIATAYVSDIKKKGQSSMFVSLCDKLHNGSSIVNDYKRLGKKYGRDLQQHRSKLLGTMRVYTKSFQNILKVTKYLKIIT
jgi:hypothetical protein